MEDQKGEPPKPRPVSSVVKGLTLYLLTEFACMQLIKALEAARGNGTSMISLIMPPKDQVARVQKMLGDEFGTASNIKNRVNRQSVLGAITSAQQRLKLYNKVESLLKWPACLSSLMSWITACNQDAAGPPLLSECVPTVE